MGLSSAHAIERAARHVLSVLSKEPEITYRMFYDGTPETAAALEEAVVEEDCRGWYSAEQLIHIAVHQLAEPGIVETESLSTTLADGENDYSIFLTARGRKSLADKLKLTFYDSE